VRVVADERVRAAPLCCVSCASRSALLQEVFDAAAARAGSDVMARAYSAARSAAEGARTARREASRTLAVVDPAAAAKRKLKRNEAKRRAKVAKAQAFAAARGTKRRR
jgi:hypothetical protein